MFTRGYYALGHEVPWVKVNYFTVTLKGLNMKILNVENININVGH